MVVVDNYDHHRTPPGLDESTYTPANASVGVHFSVVLPPFFGPDTAAADRTRVHHGTMHPKLWLLEFDRGGPLPTGTGLGAGFLRLVISSANLGRYDAKINNQVWACDFMRCEDAEEALASLSVKDLKRECIHDYGVDLGGGCERHEWQQALLEARRTATADFGSDLRRFVRALLERVSPALWKQWDDTLANYELCPPLGTHLILSVPGRYSTTRAVTQTELFSDRDRTELCYALPPLGTAGAAGTTPTVVYEAELYGQLALRRHLRAALHARPPSERPNVVEYACSSLGVLEDIMQPLLGCYPANANAAERARMRAAAFKEGLAPIAEHNSRPCEPRVKLVWPSLNETLPAFARGTGLLTIGGGKNTMTGPSDAKCNQLKHCLAHNIVHSAERAQTLHHVKMAAGIVSEAPGGSRLALVPAEGEGSARAPLCAWVYAGSHNFSGAAWGKHEKVHGSGEDSDGASSDEDVEEEEFVIMSYEIGVLIIPRTPQRFALPWRSPAICYDPTETKPFSTNRYLSILRGLGSYSTGRTAHTPAAQAQDGAELARSRWREMKRVIGQGVGGHGVGGHGGGGGGGVVVGTGSRLELPTLFEVELSKLSKLVTLRVTADGAVRSYETPPQPGSESRKRSRHLKRRDGRKDELLDSTASKWDPYPVGTELRAVRHADYSYGEGEEKRYGDPILTAYEVLSPRRSPNSTARCFVDDFDRRYDGPLAERKSTLWVDRRGPRAVLVCFLAATDGGGGARAALNDVLLLLVAACREEVQAACWGMLCLQPSELAGCTVDRYTGAPLDRTPLHADLLALELGIKPAFELPALVLMNADLSSALLTCKGPAALEALRASGGAALRAQLGALVAMPEGPDGEPGAQLPGRPVSLWRRAHESRSQRAVGAASWMREPIDASGTAEDGAHDDAHGGAHDDARDEARSSTRPRAAPKLLRPSVRLLLIEPEGVLKKQCNVSVVDDAQAAQSKRRRSLYGAARHDAFYSACVPFFRALMLRLPVEGDSYDPTSAYGAVPHTAELRPDAPQLAFVTNFGHLTSKRRPGEPDFVNEAKVRLVLAKLLRRLASELGVKPELLEQRVSLWISFRAPGVRGTGGVNAIGVNAIGVNAIGGSARAHGDGSGARGDGSGSVMGGSGSVSAIGDGCATVLGDGAHSTGGIVMSAGSELGGTLHQVATDTSKDVEARELALRWAAPRDGEWTESWCKPHPDMLLAAMKHHQVDPAHTLMIGYDFVDQEAASKAGVDYVDQQHVLGVEHFDSGFELAHMHERLVRPGTAVMVTAPGSFAAKKRSEEANQQKGEKAIPRSPARPHINL